MPPPWSCRRCGCPLNPAAGAAMTGALGSAAVVLGGQLCRDVVHVCSGDRVADAFRVGCLQLLIEAFDGAHDWRADETPVGMRRILDECRLLLGRLQEVFPPPFPAVAHVELARAARLLEDESPL